ncbi:MAG TPA: hypothetical protein VFV95_00480 [Vicinamibacterales bacterium]|nr:hypothetical protein [Vicinamibacterales bacterium]
MPTERGFLRTHAFLVAAVALPVIVAGFFIVATLIPRWTVPPPAYDLVLRAQHPYENSQLAVLAEYVVRDNRVEAIVRKAPETYSLRWALFLFDHATGTIREIPVKLPERVPDGETQTVAVEQLAGMTVRADATAPDGYELTVRTGSRSGLVGELFGMDGYRQSVVLVNRGRIVPLVLPSPYQAPYGTTVQVVGWIDSRPR